MIAKDIIYFKDLL
jgi:tRNA 2-thiouridine synthesizing protein A